MDDDDFDPVKDALEAYRAQRLTGNYEADQGIRTGHRTSMTPEEFDGKLVELHNKGLSQRTIAKRLGITHQGVSKALKRIRDGGFGRARDARHDY
jgi:DNA-binding MarR family transcriptional regulator